MIRIERDAKPRQCQMCGQTTDTIVIAGRPSYLPEASLRVGAECCWPVIVATVERVVKMNPGDAETIY